ncbi:CRISPR-associated protein Csx11 [Caldanaerobius polysaccharolyticus]|uniref:CRISPR-associated protein Csx11 n=1 Tax=Caldanaerobius polysaccharolyticus TaxID=44256 RepID=UPI00068EA614|nr:CRISPR-associated protein Csx11 [Caldanaerobius polysaccharolyticus]
MDKCKKEKNRLEIIVKEDLVKILAGFKDLLKKQIEKIDNVISSMKQAKDQSKIQERINEKVENRYNLVQKIKEYSFTLNADIKTVYKFLNVFLEKSCDGEIAAKILNTFFQDINIEKENINDHIQNIKQRMEPLQFNKENLAAYLFTQNPSPARLYRIWRETEEFSEIVIRDIKERIYYYGWKRIRFKVDYEKLKKKVGKNIKVRTPYVIKIKNLKPESILVFHMGNGEFYTIESLEKFKFNDKEGELAVRQALEEGFYYLADEEDVDEILLSNENEVIKADSNSLQSESYYPFIEITKTPLSLRLIVPAEDSIKIIELVTKLFNERFEKVLGKLPLNIKLLAANRKFPLYVLLDSERRMLEGKEFKEAKEMKPWWNTIGIRNDKYYSFYPIKRLSENEKYTLDDLDRLSKAKSYFLYPGYFDFDFLVGTSDRYRIYYERGKRGNSEYKLYASRPYYFYQISEMIELWEILKNNLSNSQINFIEEMLIRKLKEWREIKDKDKVFKEFAKATLADAFGDKWSGLEGKTKYFLVESACNKFLLDTICLFKHVIKVREVR